MAGTLTLRGISQPLSLHAVRFSCRDDADSEICGGDFEGTLLRGEFGATWPCRWSPTGCGGVQVEARRRR